MSLAPYYYRPMTPPEAAAGRHGHMRNHSNASSYYTVGTNDTSPESIITNNTTPNRSPILRHNGPTLLPKIRHQDSRLDPSSAGQSKGGHRRGSSASNLSVSNMSISSQRPPMFRSATEPVECMSMMAPMSQTQSRASSVNPSPGLAHASINRTKNAHSRSNSASSIDGSVLNRYGYPTYRHMPVYLPVQQQTPSPSIYAQDYTGYQNTSLLDPPMINLEGTYDLPIDLEILSRPSSLSPPPQTLLSQPAIETSSLLSYLTQPTQPINLVRHLSPGPSRGTVSHFWWDVRNLRPWHDFTLSHFSIIPSLFPLLNFQHDTSSLPATNPNITASPSAEADLITSISKIFFPRVNAAALLSLGGPNSISLYTAPTTNPNTAANGPSFLANYPSDADRTLTGLPRGRLVGLCKSFDRWNTGMRREGPASKVNYLKGLAHLQKCMRDHSCRYGFIITEIELLCVRAGCDERTGQPLFGYLEIAESIPLKASYNREEEVVDASEIEMSATMALYFLAMLAKSKALPGEEGSFMDVGAMGAMGRQVVFRPGEVSVGSDEDDEETREDGRDKWIPEAQVGEKREAKTVRGWVWPSDPWHKREGGGGKRRM